MISLDVDAAVERVRQARQQVSAQRSVLVAVSGIDGSGKGYVTQQIVAALQRAHVRVAAIHIDSWLNLPAVRFSTTQPAEHFYLHAIRFDALFAQLVLPLRAQRSVCVDADVAAETATAYQRQRYAFSDIDVIVLEGVYLLKRAFQGYYDLSFWIDCSFETALDRALARGQEGLAPKETIDAYHTIYFPAQKIHFERDQPRTAATAIIPNDPRMD